MIAGKEAATPGEAKNSWLTGSAAWNLVAIAQWILGIRAEHEGLRIDPCLPSGWDGYSAVRRYRGATYRITIRKPVGVTGRIRSLLVDGREVDGTVIVPAPEGRDVAVEGTVT
jgi:cellobiose phosphorylase